MLKRKRGQKVSDANVHIEHKERQQFFNRITKGGKFKKNTMLFLHDMIAKILWILNFGEEMMVIARKK